MIKLILWDIDATILNFLEAEKAAIKSCFNIFKLGTCTDEMVSVYSDINNRYWKALERGEMTKPQILRGRFTEFFEKYGIDPNVADAFNSEYQIRLGDTICFNPNALETLAVMKEKGVVQGAVTNGTKRAQDRKLERSGLNKIFDYIFISEEIGAEKPDIRFFDRAFELMRADGLQFTLDEVMIIGDSLTSDIRGGNNAKIKTCLYNPDRKKYDFLQLGVTVDHEISDLREVLTLPGVSSL